MPLDKGRSLRQPPRGGSPARHARRRTQLGTDHGHPGAQRPRHTAASRARVCRGPLAWADERPRHRPGVARRGRLGSTRLGRDAGRVLGSLQRARGSGLPSVGPGTGCAVRLGAHLASRLQLPRITRAAKLASIQPPSVVRYPRQSAASDTLRRSARWLHEFEQSPDLPLIPTRRRASTLAGAVVKPDRCPQNVPRMSPTVETEAP
jgi:hypothetical protein